MTALTVQGVTKSFGTTRVLHGVDLDAPARGLTAILGPSGCGKTTLLRLIAGFADPDTGTITLGEQTVFAGGRSVPPQRRRIGYVPQEGALFPHQSVAANIAFGLSRRERRSGHRLRELLDLVGLDREIAGRNPHELSGGQQQRVALARALAPEPDLVLLDEPFSALDARRRDDTRRAVAAALRAAGATAVLVTHDQAEALSMADQVAIMRDGRLVQIDRPATVYRQPRDAGIARFLGEAVLLPADVIDGKARCALGTLVVRTPSVTGPAEVLVRPEQLRLRHDGDGPTATVREISYYGHDAAVRLTLHPDGLPITARLSGTELPEPGSEVRVTVTSDVLAYPTPDTRGSRPPGEALVRHQ
ncbi:Fe(3+) ions import ATP-binding protein FbpC 1 [Frankia canadensis]|uniref:ABC-type quaternary amine transporter n=1 Tax=Frankia canadensis TaxID=1836972 RepID=A0A2I2KQ33_9ACTN|nr:ABC transporter ATP-binding protein [Frankia canadensis]SNQ47769.1 Fe(3+) ions import ATP-binding protein FbpC 1 [Frankia canadensis]SOU55059.1 Fe(3+) ions import ATP-binding protein FbpC 1 [Frankia canadensis]